MATSAPPYSPNGQGYPAGPSQFGGAPPAYPYPAPPPKRSKGRLLLILAAAAAIGIVLLLVLLLVFLPSISTSMPSNPSSVSLSCPGSADSYTPYIVKVTLSGNTRINLEWTTPAGESGAPIQLLVLGYTGSQSSVIYWSGYARTPGYGSVTTTYGGTYGFACQNNVGGSLVSLQVSLSYP